MAVITEIVDKVGLITLDRPDAANALDPETLVNLRDAWAELGTHKKVGALVITGKGGSFCAGMDLKKTIPMAEAIARGERIPDVAFAGLKAAPAATLQAELPPKPIIAAVNGHCHGQGTDMLVATDFRIAVPEATFALEEVEIGLFPRGNATVYLPKTIPWVKAMELVLHINPDGWTAAEALDAHLINEVVGGDALIDRALEVGGRIARFPASAVRETVLRMRAGLWESDRERAWRSGLAAAERVMAESVKAADRRRSRESTDAAADR